MTAAPPAPPAPAAASGGSQVAARQAAEDPRFATVVAAFASDPTVDRGRMFGSVGLKVNGKVFAMLVKGALVAKLPRHRVDALVAAGDGTYFDPGHGKLMKEWVAVSGDAPSWIDLAREAYGFVRDGAQGGTR
ncbi:MAG: hypothetical protein HY332_06185 [Chloroflexi bacterium]|nr:hypothetical protein [Chloroflexota bacterium]